MGATLGSSFVGAYEGMAVGVLEVGEHEGDASICIQIPRWTMKLFIFPSAFSFKQQVTFQKKCFRVPTWEYDH